MMPLVEIPEIVRHFGTHFESVFSEEAFQQFQRYVSGLIVSENKTVEGINRIFVVETRNQSSLNRWLNKSPFSVPALNDARLDMLWSLPGTAIKRKGVLSLDDTLLTHYGQHFEKISKLYDSANECYVWAHNLVNLHYSDDRTDYPIDFILWEPMDVAVVEAGLKQVGIPLQESKYTLKERDPRKWHKYIEGVWRRRQDDPEVQKLYKSKLILGKDMLRRFFAAHPHLKRTLPVTFDIWYTKPGFCKFLHKELHAAYVGTLSGSDVVKMDKTTETGLDAFDQHLQEKHVLALNEGKKEVFRKITISYKYGHNSKFVI